MVTSTDPTLSEALNQFVTAQKNGKKGVEGQQELNRFVAWCGKVRPVSRLSPSEVADYALYAGLGGPDSTRRLAPVKAFLSYLKEEGWTETGLASHLRIPRGRRPAGSGPSSRTAAKNGQQLSKATHEKLTAQLDSFKEERGKVVEDIKRAMADKDFRENAPLDAAKERQGFIEAKIRELESDLSNAQIVSGNRPVLPQQRVSVGSRVTLEDMSTGKKVVYTLVDVREADVSSGKISTTSPVGLALLSRSVGDEVPVTVPKGNLRYIIKSIGG